MAAYGAAQLYCGHAQRYNLMKTEQNLDVEEFQVGDSWQTSVNADLERSRRTAWIIALVASAIALLLTIAITVMMPLKTVEPYTLMVDRHTGHVEALAPLDEAMVSPDTALTRSFLAQYVIARESFDRGSLQRDYRNAMLWSAGEERQRYSALMTGSNTASPLAQLPLGTSISAEISSISPLTGDSSLVRFTTIRTERGGRSMPPEHWAAVINYGFSGAQMSVEDRLINPLGFQVTRYRRDRETLTASAPAQIPSASSRELAE